MSHEDAMKRAVSALEYRIHIVETDVAWLSGDPHRNVEVVKLMKEGIENDREALKILNLDFMQQLKDSYVVLLWTPPHCSWNCWLIQSGRV